MPSRFFVTAVACLAAASSAAQDAGPPRKSVGASRVDVPPVLDGVLDDPAWKRAAFVEDLHIVVSDEFGTPGERSRVYVAFDDDNLYFAARFYDSKPETIVAKVLSKRDVSFGEDGFSVTLDPAQAQVSGTPGEFSWGGAASTTFWVDPLEDLVVVFMTQLMPSTQYNIRRELRAMVYAALTD